MTTFDIRKVNRRRIYQEVVDQLVDIIVSGKAPPGTQLPSERDLVEQFGVSRSSVREALFALQKMGLIALSNGERASVVEPKSSVLVGELTGAVRYYLSRPSGVRDFQGARTFFEVGLARHAAMHATPDEIASLKRALEANRQAKGDIEHFIDTDVAFHFVLAEIGRNEIFTTLHAALAKWLRDQRAISVAANGAADAAIEAHTRIYEAIARGDPDAAEREMRAHLQQVVDFYWSSTEDGCP